MPSMWIDIDFIDVREGDLIRSSTTPISQQHLGHPEADRSVEGVVMILGNSMQTTMILNSEGENVVLAYYVRLGNDVFINLKKLVTVTHRQIVNRETGKRGPKRKREQSFGKRKHCSLRNINRDIFYLQ